MFLFYVSSHTQCVLLCTMLACHWMDLLRLPITLDFTLVTQSVITSSMDEAVKESISTSHTLTSKESSRESSFFFFIDLFLPFLLLFFLTPWFVSQSKERILRCFSFIQSTALQRWRETTTIKTRRSVGYLWYSFRGTWVSKVLSQMPLLLLRHSQTFWQPCLLFVFFFRWLEHKQSLLQFSVDCFCKLLQKCFDNTLLWPFLVLPVLYFGWRAWCRWWIGISKDWCLGPLLLLRPFVLDWFFLATLLEIHPHLSTFCRFSSRRSFFSLRSLLPLIPCTHCVQSLSKWRRRLDNWRRATANCSSCTWDFFLFYCTCIPLLLFCCFRCSFLHEPLSQCLEIVLWDNFRLLRPKRIKRIRGMISRSKKHTQLFAMFVLFENPLLPMRSL